MYEGKDKVEGKAEVLDQNRTEIYQAEGRRSPRCGDSSQADPNKSPHAWRQADCFDPTSE